MEGQRKGKMVNLPVINHEQDIFLFLGSCKLVCIVKMDENKIVLAMIFLCAHSSLLDRRENIVFLPEALHNLDVPRGSGHVCISDEGGGLTIVRDARHSNVEEVNMKSRSHAYEQLSTGWTGAMHLMYNLKISEIEVLCNHEVMIISDNFKLSSCL